MTRLCWQDSQYGIRLVKRKRGIRVVRVAIIEANGETPLVTELLTREIYHQELVFSASSFNEACRLYNQFHCDLCIIHSDDPDLLCFASYLKEQKHDVEVVVFTHKPELLSPVSRPSFFGALQSGNQLEFRMREIEKTLEKKNAAAKQQQQEILVQRNLERYVRLGIISSVVMGKADDDWTEEFYDQLLSPKKNIAIFAMINIKKVAFSAQVALSLCPKIEEQMKNLTIRVLKENIICLYLGPGLKEKALGDILKRIIISVYPITLKEDEISIVETDSSKTFKGLLSSFSSIRDAFPITHILPSWKPLEIYNLEIQLSRQIENGNWVKVRETLNVLGDYVNELNHGDVVINRSYYSHLWRLIDRSIWKNTGKRITIVEKSLIDFKLSLVGSIASFNELMFEFLHELVSAMALGSHGQSHKLVQKAKEYIAINYGREAGLGPVAEYLGISNCHLSKIFKKIEGLNYKEYVISIRMERAKLLLAEGNLNTSEISRLVGYPNPNYFSQAFKTYCGVSPTDFSGRRKKQ